MRAMKPADVLEVARKYFREETRTAVVLVPKNDRYDWRALEKKLTGTFATETRKPLPAKPSRAGGLEPQVVKRPSGLTTVRIDRPSTGVTSVHISALGGLRADAPLFGSSNLAAQVWTRGTKRLDANAISREIESRACSLEGFSGRNSLGLSWTGLARDWDSIAPLIAEVLSEPSFVSSEIDHEKRIVEDQLRGIEESTS